MNLKMNIVKTKLKKGDSVKILLGKDSGKTGKIEKVLNKNGRVFVGGVNLYKRHVKKMGDMEGGIIDLPKSLQLSNVGLICPNCSKVTRIGLKMDGATKVRFCRKCKKEIK